MVRHRIQSRSFMQRQRERETAAATLGANGKNRSAMLRGISRRLESAFTGGGGVTGVYSCVHFYTIIIYKISRKYIEIYIF